ncbi:F-box only protein 9 [Halyomorpha halys]|uniref:F-box only protein 9 n=1 Tax=Halyomorpha halys TaxID=286706 RepID=UPI0006D4CE57|nr:F-box only protein 9 [Halyomorpha halys]
MDRGSGHGGEGPGETEGEDQDESSSRFRSGTSNALEEFRNEWRRELEKSPKHLNNVKTISDPVPNNVEDKAKTFFKMGIEFENKGKLYEAIQFYRRAVQLVPDIELRIFQQSTSHSEVTSEDEGHHDDSDGSEGIFEEEEVAYEPGSDLLAHLLYISHKVKKIQLCSPQQPSNMTHLSALPMEIFLYILRWVVSKDLDLRSLEMCSRVCRGFYICARDPEIWRTACTRIWGMKCGGVGSLYLSWREMFIHRPRLCFEGCYISKTTYIRHGENSFQDQFYKPWHLVEYFRYLRFFPDGRVLSLTTAEEPVSSVGLLKTRTPPPRHPPVFVGYYRLVDKTVSVVLMPGPDKYKNRCNTNNQSPTFHMELEIATYKKRLHGQLVWRGYSLFTRRNGVEINTDFDLPSARYPPFWFSRVKSYSSETNHPLCK